MKVFIINIFRFVEVFKAYFFKSFGRKIYEDYFVKVFQGVKGRYRAIIIIINYNNEADSVTRQGCGAKL